MAQGVSSVGSSVEKSLLETMKQQAKAGGAAEKTNSGFSKEQAEAKKVSSQTQNTNNTSRIDFKA